MQTTPIAGLGDPIPGGSTRGDDLGLEGERASGDEALLVGERQVDARLEGRQRCLDSREPNDGVDHDVGL